VKATPFSGSDTAGLLAAIERRYDVVIAPTIPPGSVILRGPPDAGRSRAALELTGSSDRAAVYARSALDISPTTDDRPYFFQFFRWEQTPAVLETRPALAAVRRQRVPRRRCPPGSCALATALFIVLPIALGPRSVRRWRRRARGARCGDRLRRRDRARLPVRRGLLVGRLIVLVGALTLAFASVVGGMLLWSGSGASRRRGSWRPAMVLLAASSRPPGRHRGACPAAARTPAPAQESARCSSSWRRWAS
jgi:hypothetical protein